MSKFKVGDRVRRTSNFSSSLGEFFREGSEFNVSDITGGGSIVDPHGYNHGEDFLELVIANPVRTVTKLEIVPGKYAGFHVGATDAGMVHVVQGTDEMYTAAELRAAARVFNSLAEALEEMS